MKETCKRPLVSVFMPTYNHEHYIAESIESVLSQDYEDMEIIIVDDASTDRTPEIIKEYDREYPGLFKIKINDKNLGVTQTCNVVLSMCTGKYVAFTSGDDVWLPGKLNKLIPIMEANSDCVLVYHDIEVFSNVDNSTVRYWNSGYHGNKAFEGNCSDILKLLVERGTEFMAAISVLVQRKRIPSWGFDYRVPIASDWLMWIDILASGAGTVKFVPEILARYRRHGTNITNRENIVDPFMTLAIVESRYPWLIKSIARGRSYRYYAYGVWKIQIGDKGLGRHLLLWGARKSIFSWKWIIWWIISFAPASFITAQITARKNLK